MADIKPWRHRCLLLAADAAGRVVRVVRGGLPGLAGAAAIAYGLGQVYGPLFWITAGVFGLLLDHRMAGAAS